MKKIFTLIIILGLIVLNHTVFAQSITISGTVLEQPKNLSIPSVNIYIKSGATLKAVGITDNKGHFIVKVADGTDLLFRCVGYQDVTQKAHARKEMIVYMQEKVNNMNEVVVVVGYQEKRKELSTGSIKTLTAKDIQDVPAANIVELLQGKVAGLNIQNNNGTPGMMGTIALRGISNINVVGSGSTAYLTPSSPLFVVDGIPVDMTTGAKYGFDQAGPGISPLALIPTEDIAEMLVLKDAQATSLYGSRGAYGVIIINTKRGKSAIPIISYSGKFFVSTVPGLRTVIGGISERAMRINQVMKFDTAYYHALNTVNSTPFLADSLNAYYNNSTDWQSYFYRTTYNQSHDLTMSGGSTVFNYKVATSLFDQKGIIENTGFTRYNLSMNMQYQPSNKFTMVAYINNSLTKNSKGSGNALVQRGVATAGNTSSLLPAPSLYTASNSALAAATVDDASKIAGINTNLQLTYRPLTGLSVSSQFSYNYNDQTENTFSPAILNNNNNKVYAFSSQNSSLYSRSSFQYVYRLHDAHEFSVFGFTELSIGKSRYNIINYSGTPNDQIQGPIGYNYLLSGTSSSYTPDNRSLGYSGAFSYNYKKKYVLDVNYRIDGTSTNGTDNPWKKNPAGGIKWNFNYEDFMKDLTWIDFGSVRASWGRTIVPSGTIYDVYGKYLSSGSYNNVSTVSLDLTTIPNTALVPSRSTQLDYGLDLGLMKGKYSLTFDYYYKQSDFQLSTRNLANHNVFTNISTNETSVVTKGYELDLSFRPLNPESKWKWTFSVNGSIIRDYLAALPDEVRQIITNGGDLGQPIVNRLGSNSLSNFLLNYNGVYSTDKDVPVDPLTGLRYRVGGTASKGSYFRAGDPIWTDLNGDYILDNNDFVITGNSQPRFVGGFSSYLQYKQFSMNVSMSYTIGRDVLNNATASLFQNYSNPLSQNALVPISQYNFWTSPGDVATYPNPFDYTRSALVRPFQYIQTLFQEDGSYLKINSITLSYNLNPGFSKKFGITSCRVYATGSNIATFSNYSGPSAERVDGLGRDNSGGYPLSRNFTFGLNIQF